MYTILIERSVPRNAAGIFVLKFGMEEDNGHMIHAVVGMFLILLSNGLVIIGILCNIHFLLIPWLLIYILGIFFSDNFFFQYFLSRIGGYDHDDSHELE